MPRRSDGEGSKGPAASRRPGASARRAAPEARSRSSGAATPGPLPCSGCPPRPTPARSASASSARGSATPRACATCSPHRSTSPACACRGAPAWWSAAARWGSRRSRGCSSAAAEVTLVAPQAVPELVDYAREGSIRWERREFRDSDLDGRFLAVAATSVTEVNISVYEGAERRAMLCNVVDVPPLCNFILPAIVRSGPAGDRDLDRRRLPGARQAAEARDRRGLRRALRAPGGDPQRGPRLGQGDASHLPGPQGVLRGDRQRRAGPGGADQGRPRAMRCGR